MGFEFLNLSIEGEKEQVAFNGIPFHVFRQDKKAMPMPYWKPVNVDRVLEGIFFLGMTTQALTGECGWGGERYHAYQRKLYIGDILGRMDIHYESNQVDAIPLIFGVNVWNYDTFSCRKDYEGVGNLSIMPYREPFDSDKAARKLFADSLLLYENDGDKYTRYIFAFETRNRKIRSITLGSYGGRDAGVGISAITAFTPGTAVPYIEQWRFTDISFYIKKEYYTAMDKLAKRLYQFLDEMPERFPVDRPSGYSGPVLALKGAPEAQLLANIYYHNIYDMMYNKVEEDGSMHTSTKDAPCYGFYSGIGTFRNKGHYNYYEQVWTRDIGRLLCELIEHGEAGRCMLAAEKLLKYLYDGQVIYKHPHWKRIANSSELGFSLEGNVQEASMGKENDGHASIMLMIYRLYQHRLVDTGWIRDNFKKLADAAEWFCWQMDNPEQSDFEDVLCSESESSYVELGGYDLFSNSYAWYALLSFCKIAHDLGETGHENRWKEYAGRLWAGIEKVFIGTHPRYGKVFWEPESNNWPSELKRMASLFLTPEIFGYDTAEVSPQLMDLWMNTYRAQKEIFFSPMVGGAMGYGQGYATQIALLLDEVEDYTQCLNWAARFSYHHTDYPYIVPEGVTYHPSGRFWYRHTDLGNAVQQTEIIKCIRLVIGLDDLNPEEGLRLVPRMPDGWDGIEMQEYPVVASVEESLTGNSNEISRVNINLRYSRIPGGYELTFNSEKPVKAASLRIGPFPPETETVKVEGMEAIAILKRRGSRLYAYIPLDSFVRNLLLTVTTLPYKR